MICTVQGDNSGHDGSHRDVESGGRELELRLVFMVWWSHCLECNPHGDWDVVSCRLPATRPSEIPCTKRRLVDEFIIAELRSLQKFHLVRLQEIVFVCFKAL